MKPPKYIRIRKFGVSGWLVERRQYSMSTGYYYKEAARFPKWEYAIAFIGGTHVV